MEIAKQFTYTIRKLETLYRNEAERQVKAAHIMYWQTMVNLIN